MTTVTEKEPNYTAEQVQQLREAAPLDVDKAKALGKTMGKSYRSIIAKAKREGIEYIAKAPEPKKGKDAPTKAQMVEAMRSATGLKLPDLEKASAACLNELAKWMHQKLAPASE
jgi:hypothetical protein